MGRIRGAGVFTSASSDQTKADTDGVRPRETRKTHTGMDENGKRSPDPFRISLRTLMLIVTACGVLFSAICMGSLSQVLALGLICSVILTIVAAWARQQSHLVDGLLAVYIVGVLGFLVFHFLAEM
jgi:hypothetical protein